MASRARTRSTASAPACTTPTAPLTAAIARGDEHAFATFYELWFDRTLALARSISRRDESFCLDVVQDCMLRVVRAMRPLTSESAVHAWMARTVLTTTLDHLRRAGRRARRELRVATDESAAAGSDPRLAAETVERQDWLRARLAELPSDDRRLLVERFAGDRTLAAVGASLGITGDAAHGRIRRLITRLRSAARELFDD